MAKCSVNSVAKIILKLSEQHWCNWRTMNVNRRGPQYRFTRSTFVAQYLRSFSAGILPVVKAQRCWTRSLADLVLIAVVMVSPTTMVAAQSVEPCPPSSSEAGDVTENLIKGTMRYHEWAIEVLEEVTAGVSGRLKSPEGADSNSITVFMDVVAGGEIDQLAVEQGSGDTVFDDEFLQAIQSLAPFSIDTVYMEECSLSRLALSIKWLNGGSLTEIRTQQ